MQGNSITNLIANIYAADRRSERGVGGKWAKLPNKMLLWHGTRGENLIGILQTGFRIAPSDASRTGSLFGEGIYFADTFSKSFQYANTSNNHMWGFRNNRKFGSEDNNKPVKKAKKYMFLCEVSLGTMKVLTSPTPEVSVNMPNDDFQSVMGYGRTGPNPKGNIYLTNGCAVPLGKVQNNPPLEKEKGAKSTDFGNNWSLQNNEYVVYNTSQVKIKYILELRDLN